MKPALTPEAMLADMGLHARSSVVHVEPTTVAEWRECIGHVLCGAAFDAGLAQGGDAGDLDVLKAAVGLAQRTEREACARLFFDMASTGDVSLDEMVRTIRARGAK